jgi:outer membrane protein
MEGRNLGARGLATALAVAVISGLSTARAENLAEAWGIALGVNQQLQAQQQSSVAASFSVKAANSARWFTVRSYNIDAFLAQSPKVHPTAVGPSTPAIPALPTVTILGPHQTFFPISLTSASIPLYTGGRLTKTVDSARSQLNAQKTEESRTAIDLKLTVAEAYIGVLRARRNLDTARSNVEQLSSFARDVKNRMDQGLAIRSDDLAAQVSLANAQLSEIQARTTLESAWATYNRYLCRPLDQFADLQEISDLPTDPDYWREMALRVAQNRGEFAGKNDAEVRDLTARAFQVRPELAGLAEQARALGFQADATRAALRPQVSVNGGFIFLGAENFIPQGNGYVALIADWTFTDSGKTRRQSESIRAQGRATAKRRADLAQDVALQVRTRWLDLQQAHQRVPIARFAVIQAEENVKVITDRYRQQLATYTEVLDAETRRVTSLNGFYNAVYDENLATFRLRRSVGDI